MKLNKRTKEYKELLRDALDIARLLRRYSLWKLICILENWVTTYQGLYHSGRVIADLVATNASYSEFLDAVKAFYNMKDVVSRERIDVNS